MLRESAGQRRQLGARRVYAFRLGAHTPPRPNELDANRRVVRDSSSNGSSRIRRPLRRVDRRATRSTASTPREQAAWTLVANALLNLDEVFTKQ